MSDYLSNLVARSFAPIEEIRPRLASRFESSFVEDEPGALQRMNAEHTAAVQPIDEPDSSTSGPVQPLGDTPVKHPLERERPASELQVSVDAPSSSLSDFTSTLHLHSEKPTDQLQRTMPQPPTSTEQRPEQTLSQAAPDSAQPISSQRAEPQVQMMSIQPAPRESRQQSDLGAPPLFMTPAKEPTEDSSASPPRNGTNGQDPSAPDLVLQPPVVEQNVSSPEVQLTSVRADTPSLFSRKTTEKGRQPGLEPLIQEIVAERSIPSAEQRAGEINREASDESSSRVGDQHPRPMSIPAIDRPGGEEVEHVVFSTESPISLAPSESALIEEIPASKASPMVVWPHVVSRMEASTPDTPIAPPASNSMPTVQVTIGRIEVRATPPPAPLPKTRRPTPPVMSLDEYLRQRSGRSAQ